MREYFLIDPDVIFLNHGSFGACSRPVFERYQAWQRELEAQPVAFLGRRYDDLMRDALATLGAFVGTDGTNLVFVPNATVGLNTVARSLDLDAGDVILTTDHEYGALDLTWAAVCRDTGARIERAALPLPLSDPQQVIDALFAQVTPATKVLFLSHITSPTALVLPVAQICQRARQQGILTVIDGAHVPGHLPLNLDDLGADFYSGNCHKWLCAPKGAALLYVRPEHHDTLQALTVSWGSDGDSLFERTRWQGTRDPAAYLSVPEAIAFQQAHDWETVAARCRDLAREALHRVSDLTGLPPLASDDFFAQMVPAPLPAEADLLALNERLYDDYRIEIPLLELGNWQHARISIAAYTTRADVDALLAALRDLL